VLRDFVSRFTLTSPTNPERKIQSERRYNNTTNGAKWLL
jgi:hypothetical protein